MRDNNIEQSTINESLMQLLIRLYWCSPIGYIPFIYSLKMYMDKNFNIGIIVWGVAIILLIIARFLTYRLSIPFTKVAQRIEFKSFSKFASTLVFIGILLGWGIPYLLPFDM